MKIIRFLNLILLTALMALATFSCTKKEIQGPQGDPGTPGNGGNSNIVSTATFVIASSQWTANADSTLWQHTINMPEVTDAVANEGALKVYIQQASGWWELPFLAGEFFMQFGFSTGKVTLSYLDPHAEKIQRPATANYRVVILQESHKPASAGDPSTGGSQVSNEKDLILKH